MGGFGKAALHFLNRKQFFTRENRKTVKFLWSTCMAQAFLLSCSYLKNGYLLLHIGHFAVISIISILCDLFEKGG